MCLQLLSTHQLLIVKKHISEGNTLIANHFDLQSQMAIKRLRKELLEFIRDPPTGCYAGPINSEDMFHWQAIIKGQVGSPYQKGTFYLDIVFPRDYPFKPPNINFQTKIYHHMSMENGRVCMCNCCFLRDQWSPALTISKVLVQLSNFISSPPGTDCYHNQQIFDLYKKDKAQYEKRIREYTEKYASQ